MIKVLFLFPNKNAYEQETTVTEVGTLIQRHWVKGTEIRITSVHPYSVLGHTDDDGKPIPVAVLPGHQLGHVSVIPGAWVEEVLAYSEADALDNAVEKRTSL